MIEPTEEQLASIPVTLTDIDNQLIAQFNLDRDAFIRERRKQILMLMAIEQQRLALQTVK